MKNFGYIFRYQDYKAQEKGVEDLVSVNLVKVLVLLATSSNPNRKDRSNYYVIVEVIEIVQVTFIYQNFIVIYLIRRDLFNGLLIKPSMTCNKHDMINDNFVQHFNIVLYLVEVLKTELHY